MKQNKRGSQKNQAKSKQTPVQKVQPTQPQPHSPRNGEIVNGKPYDRKFAFGRDDKYQLIDKAYNQTYRAHLKEIVETLRKRVERHDGFYKKEALDYLSKKEFNFKKSIQSSGLKIKSPRKKFDFLLDSTQNVTAPVILTSPDNLWNKTPKQKQIKSSSGNGGKTVIKIKKAKNLTIVINN